MKHWEKNKCADLMAKKGAIALGSTVWTFPSPSLKYIILLDKLNS